MDVVHVSYPINHAPNTFIDFPFYAFRPPLVTFVIPSRRKVKGENQAASPTSFLMGGSRPAPPGVKEENGDPIGVPQFGTYHGTICCIGMSQILYRRVVTSVSPLPKPREQRWSRFLESMPRVTRSTPIPTPPVETVPTVGTAPISASPLATPDPNPSRALASYVEPQSPRGPTVFHALSRGGWRGP